MKHLSPSPIEILNCPTLSKEKNIAHGFFTRKGGISQGIYASLNCGYGSGDNQDHVKFNRSLVAHYFGPYQEEDLFTVFQNHTNIVYTLTHRENFDRSFRADAIVTTLPKVILGILTADCGPVLFADSHAGVVGAAHAGWKGAFSGILENTILAMEGLGAKRDRITATIGPCIGPASYEVGAEFYERFMATDPYYSTFFKPTSSSYYFDLPGFVTYRLKEAHIPHITCLHRDTCAEQDSFFSWRYMSKQGKKDYGRLISAICLEPR